MTDQTEPEDWTEQLPQVDDIEPMPAGVEPVDVDEPLPIAEPEVDQ